MTSSCIINQSIAQITNTPMAVAQELDPWDVGHFSLAATSIRPNVTKLRRCSKHIWRAEYFLSEKPYLNHYDNNIEPLWSITLLRNTSRGGIIIIIAIVVVIILSIIVTMGLIVSLFSFMTWRQWRCDNDDIDVEKLTYQFPNFNGATVEVWEWVSNFTPHVMMDVINCPCRDCS